MLGVLLLRSPPPSCSRPQRVDAHETKENRKTRYNNNKIICTFSKGCGYFVIPFTVGIPSWRQATPLVESAPKRHSTRGEPRSRVGGAQTPIARGRWCTRRRRHWQVPRPDRPPTAPAIVGCPETLGTDAPPATSAHIAGARVPIGLMPDRDAGEATRRVSVGQLREKRRVSGLFVNISIKGRE